MRAAALLLLLSVAACSSGDSDDDDAGDQPPAGDIVCAGAIDGWAVDVGEAPFSRDDQAALADLVVERLPEAQPSYPTRAPDSCGDADAAAYLRGLAANGDSAACLSYATECTAEATRDPATVGVLAYLGAACAADEQRAEQARALYELATAPASIGDCPDGRGRAFSYAWFEIGQASEHDLVAILGRAEGWDPAAAESAIRQLAAGGTASDPAALEAWIVEAVGGSDPLLAQILTVTWIGEVAYVYGDRDRALRMVDANLEPLTASGRITTLVSLVFSFLYSMGGGDLSIARQVYDGYVPFSSPYGWLPNEQNVLTYTQIYEEACAGATLAGEALASYHDLRLEWIEGEIANPDALAEVDAQLAGEGERAELLSFRGALLEAGGDSEAAAAAYWRAHELCPYYNRAHWALQQIHLATDLHKFEPLEPPAFPAKDALASYVVNYESLTDDELTGLRHGLSIWLPYLDDLVATGNTFYAKRPFELLSETPGHDDLRDQRVTYEEDYRLWDDVRGLGGNPVVADLSEVMLAPYGAYNLAIHEVSHQLHFAAPPAIAACIEALYEGASERGRFVNYYASYNSAEYFAEGVTYFSVPPDAPGRYGPNRQWLIDNDRDLDAFIAAFADETPLADVTCPVDVPASSRRARAPEPSRLWRLLHGTTQHRPSTAMPMTVPAH